MLAEAGCAPVEGIVAGMTPTATIATAIFEGTGPEHYGIAPFELADEVPERAEGVVITRCHTAVVEAGQALANDLLAQLDLAAGARRMLFALDAGDRLVLQPARLPSTAKGASVGMIWRIGRRPAESRADVGDFASFAAPGHVKARWDIRIEPATTAGCLLTIRTELTATDDEARARLLDAWGLVEPLSSAVVHRIARTIKDAAESDESWM